MSSINILETGSADFEKDVLKNKIPVVLDFYSTECPPCEALAPKFESLAEEYAGKVAFVKIFRQGNRDISEKFGITGSPRVLFFKNGQALEKMLTGAIKKSEMKQIIDEELLK